MFKDNLRVIPIDRLKEILVDLPRATLIAVGPDGNLALLDPDLRQFAYIDLVLEMLCIPESAFASHPESRPIC